MQIKQFEDKNLSHYSYAILSNHEVALIDPARDPQPYYDFAAQHHARIVAVIETHPHADFVSSHLEIAHHTGASIYVSKLLGAEYPHQSFDEGDAILLGHITLKALNTPGHSPDSISIVALDESEKEKAVFTGDTLFIGDCGRPDLREKAGAITAARSELARQMYHSLREKLLKLPDEVEVYPAHGAGSLCGKGLSEQNRSTIGAEKISNWSLQEMSEELFVQKLLEGQPYVPKYFPFNVGINKKGAEDFSKSILKIKKINASAVEKIDPSVTVIDTRPQAAFKKGHLKNAINLMRDRSFETWLGSIVNSGEPFYLIAENEERLDQLIARIAKIGYEQQIKLGISGDIGTTTMEYFDSEELKKDHHAFTILDIRNPAEVEDKKIFQNSINIPLYELRDRIGEIPNNKPIVVHCAAGFRSAAGSSIVHSKFDGVVKVYDLSDAVKNF
ncbi:MAG TPA: MBL fold metallo-hydrolase [Chitinophagaceae bacterium]|nr:MBL fold metallo-hydrolase [Chitinophagaceae bacterium]